MTTRDVQGRAACGVPIGPGAPLPPNARCSEGGEPPPDGEHQPRHAEDWPSVSEEPGRRGGGRDAEPCPHGDKCPQLRRIETNGCRVREPQGWRRGTNSMCHLALIRAAPREQPHQEGDQENQQDRTDSDVHGMTSDVGSQPCTALPGHRNHQRARSEAQTCASPANATRNAIRASFRFLAAHAGVGRREAEGSQLWTSGCGF